MSERDSDHDWGNDMNVLDRLRAADRALTENNLEAAARLINEAERELAGLEPSERSAQIRGNLGCLMIDLGDWTGDEPLIARGTQLVQNALAAFHDERLQVMHLYNAGNGYCSLWKMRQSAAWSTGRLSNDYLQAKKMYRQGIDLSKKDSSVVSNELRRQLYVNYANALDSHARVVEAIEYYDRAIALDSAMGEALGNKGMALFRMFHLMRRYRHLFLLESERLLQRAVQSPLHAQMAETFRAALAHICKIMESHKDLRAEQINEPQARSPFQSFLQDFCAEHHLFLTPVTLLDGTAHRVYGDPMFISEMTAPLEDTDKFPRYVTFLNQIKQDYVLARYFLVQSQYKSSVIDIVDDGVTLYYPLDYSLDGAYIHMLKTSMRLALDILDKIGYFIRDYCNVQALARDQVTFRNVFAERSDPDVLRPELQQARNNPFIFALFDLAHDLGRDGYYSPVYERRNALTHRFLVVHDIMMSDENTDIPRVRLDEFRKECIQAMQIARTAVMSLILFVDLAESGQSPDRALPLPPALPADGISLWKPVAG